MRDDTFVHLHNHSEYSVLDGAAKVDKLIEAAQADNQPAIAVTDHGNLYGLVDFYRQCQKADLKFIPGIESYFTDDRTSRTRASGSDIDGSNKLYYHLTVLAENDDGYRNLLKLSSESFLSGYYY